MNLKWTSLIVRDTTSLEKWQLKHKTHIISPTMKTEAEIIALYVATYPHLAALAASGQRRPLGDAMSRLAYPAGISGLDALTISKIGL